MINIIANVTSGKGRGLKNTKKIVEYCMKKGVPYALYFTNRIGHATEITRSLTQSGEKTTVIALGGDGTFHEVLNGIVDTENTYFGFIPSGRGNDFARSLGASTNPIEALEDILRGETQKIDYIQVGDKRCLNVCGTGLDVAVLKAVEGKKSTLTYYLALIQCLRKFKPYTVSIDVDGKKEDFDCIMVGACNGKAFGGNMKICPVAEINDGKMNVVLITWPENTNNIWPIVAKFVVGKHMDLPITHHYVCESLTVTAPYPIELDGEIYEDRKLECKIVKEGINTFVPRKK
jgi:YegS/Rv2252/BmrU family lipid kinase